MPNFKDFYFDSSTGKNRIHARCCTPDSTPRAIIQIEHGIAEYIDRYDDFMNFLAENGFVAVGDDHLGHGKTAETPEQLGFFAEKDGWDYVLRDMDKLRETIRSEYPDLPYILFGHSMGSFLVRTYIIKNPEKYDAAVICGTGHQPKPVVLSGYALACAAVKLKGPHGDGTALNNIAFGSYNKGYKEHRTEFDWLNRDNELVDKYIADPLCGFVATVSLFRDMMGGIKFVTNQKNIDLMNKNAPIYFMSGGADPVGENGKGVNRAYNAFLKAGLKDVFMRIYPDAHHEILNEINHKEVYNDLLEWLNEKLEKIK